MAAVGSWLEARSSAGQWLLRIEDVDRPRTVIGAEDAILRTLDACGLYWDGPVIRQSERSQAYLDALERLIRNGWVYPCACSRREIEERTRHRADDGALIYPGTCRAGIQGGREPRAWRLRVPDEELVFEDRLLGPCTQHLGRGVGDCVLWRVEGVAAYQLAVVVDDAAQGVTDVVRGADLFEATPRQIHLQRCLGVPTPRYAHLPVMANDKGEKLSKQTLAPAIGAADGSLALTRALSFLGHAPPAELHRAETETILAWALANWALGRVPAERSVAVPEAAYASSGSR